MELRTLLAYATPYRWPLTLVALLMLCSSALTLAVPWLAGQLLGGLFTGQGAVPDALVGWLLLALGLIAALKIVSAWLSGSISTRLLADLRQRVYDHLQSLPLAFHQAHRQGDTLALMTWEVSRLSQFLSGTLVSVPPLLLTALGACVLMLRIDPLLALLVPLLVPAFYLILKIVGRRLRGLAQALQEAEAGVVSLAEENLEMLPALKSFTREAAESHRYRTQIDQAMRLTLRQNRIYAAMEPLIGFIAAAAAVLLLFFAGQSLHAGNLSAAELFSFLFYAALLTQPVGALANLYGQIQTTRGTLARLQNVLQEPPEPGYAATGRLPAAHGEIRFEGLRFAYPGRELTLDGVDLLLRAGETVALTGPNGAGKSTLVALLLRLYEPQGGRILLDGQDIAGIQLQDLRRQIGVVPQRALLFNGSVRANIAYGLPGASEAQIEHAARLAQAWAFIQHLPQGLDTEIGDHGVRLSGGQRQRIALARAFVKDPPILVLDEATSMYDLEGESAFIEACADALHGRTVILITHRPASLALAQRILRVENGRVIETGETRP
ncbi:ABC transporter ATP-binding protein [Pseudomonas sp. N040]|uniref:ABC transporter ATP-binding protein n=1 Tax=Pseudomonas sp. N040 TaxID=2785325 RepID=UPI0018A31F97|nr:ABC transporter ATP-binding protein [Pseudomonas sp. N040]MBF7728666.1 ABC transporter ATP-binding protein [Pseudomonas sp. N040]MBW7012306.1 ABC transporter ATP-binding protein/permease [Pseudomonas sp. N040]